MLPKAQRINKTKDIQTVFRRGLKRTTPDFLIWIKRAPTGTFRAAVVCSKQVDKKATARNLIKRRVREILRKDISKKFPNLEIVVTMRAGAKGKTSRELKESILDVFSR